MLKIASLFYMMFTIIGTASANMVMTPESYALLEHGQQVIYPRINMELNAYQNPDTKADDKSKSYSELLKNKNRSHKDYKAWLEVASSPLSYKENPNEKPADPRATYIGPSTRVWPTQVEKKPEPEPPFTIKKGVPGTKLEGENPITNKNAPPVFQITGPAIAPVVAPFLREHHLDSMLVSSLVLMFWFPIITRPKAVTMTTHLLIRKQTIFIVMNIKMTKVEHQMKIENLAGDFLIASK